jgi:hypothetical protein
MSANIVDLTTESEEIEISRPQVSPAKINNLKKQKKKVSFPADISAPIMSTTQTVTDTQASDKITLSQAKKIIETYEAHLINSKIFPLPSWCKIELLNDHILTEVQKKKLEDQLGSVFFFHF